VLYAFNVMMLLGRDVRTWPLEERGRELRQAIKGLPDIIRYSETFNVSLAELEHAVREHQLEGIVAKRAGSPYCSGERCGDWLKWRANLGQEFVISGYIPHGSVVDSLLVGYYDGQDHLNRMDFSMAPASLQGYCRRAGPLSHTIGRTTGLPREIEIWLAVCRERQVAATANRKCGWGDELPVPSCRFRHPAPDNSGPSIKLCDAS